MTCDNHTNRCDVCDERLCERCGRCYERHPGPHGNTRTQCPSAWCRRIKFLKRVVFT